MNSNQIRVINSYQERNEKVITHGTHSTDTEPDAENEIYNVHRQEHTKEKIESENNTDSIQKKTSKNGFQRFISKIPSYEYNIPKKPKNALNKSKIKEPNDFVPLDAIDTNNNRFVSFREAFFYVCQHCNKYHSRFTREKCREYLKSCYILDFSHDEFIPILKKLTTKEFNKYFTLTNREAKFI